MYLNVWKIHTNFTFLYVKNSPGCYTGAISLTFYISLFIFFHRTYCSTDNPLLQLSHHMLPYRLLYMFRILHHDELYGHIRKCVRSYHYMYHLHGNLHHFHILHHILHTSPWLHKHPHPMHHR